MTHYTSSPLRVAQIWCDSPQCNEYRYDNISWQACGIKNSLLLKKINGS
jgi:hypothetical protein